MDVGLEDELMFDLDVNLVANYMARQGLGALRRRSCKLIFSHYLVKAEAYIGEIDDSIDDTHLQHDLKRHPSAQA